MIFHQRVLGHGSDSDRRHGLLTIVAFFAIGFQVSQPDNDLRN
jgi:hypothetical protein